MGSSEAIVIVLVSLLVSGGILMGVVMLVAGLVLLPPVLVNRRIGSWSGHDSCFGIWEALDRGATRGPFQVRPASFLFEEDRTSPYPPEQATALIAGAFGSRWGRKVIRHEPNAVAVSLRFFPWAAVDFGWVGVAWAFPHGSGSVVRFRFRSTYMWPVITFFLSLRLRMWVVDRLW